MEFLAHVQTECSYQSLSPLLAKGTLLPLFFSHSTLVSYSQLHLWLLKYLHANDFLNGSSLKLVWNSKLPREQFSTNCFSIARLLDHPSLTIHPVSSEICTCKEPAQSRSLALTRLQAKKRYANDHAITSRSPCYSGTRAARARAGHALRGGHNRIRLVFQLFHHSHQTARYKRWVFKRAHRLLLRARKVLTFFCWRSQAKSSSSLSLMSSC